MGLISEKKKKKKKKKKKITFACRVKTATSCYSATDDLLQYIYPVLVAKNHDKIQSRFLVHKFSFTYIF